MDDSDGRTLPRAALLPLLRKLSIEATHVLSETQPARKQRITRDLERIDIRFATLPAQVLVRRRSRAASYNTLSRSLMSLTGAVALRDATSTSRRLGRTSVNCRSTWR